MNGNAILDDRGDTRDNENQSRSCFSPPKLRLDGAPTFRAGFEFSRQMFHGALDTKNMKVQDACGVPV
jgi:hypothetical protein